MSDALEDDISHTVRTVIRGLAQRWDISMQDARARVRWALWREFDVAAPTWAEYWEALNDAGIDPLRANSAEDARRREASTPRVSVSPGPVSSRRSSTSSSGHRSGSSQRDRRTLGAVPSSEGGSAQSRARLPLCLLGCGEFAVLGVRCGVGDGDGGAPVQGQCESE